MFLKQGHRCLAGSAALRTPGLIFLRQSRETVRERKIPAFLRGLPHPGSGCLAEAFL
ncbi:MAG: hypothetical protein HPY58_09425 [Firmicutes bacterium]|nr:hypothetical protein [Bacillota bacterium]